MIKKMTLTQKLSNLVLRKVKADEPTTTPEPTPAPAPTATTAPVQPAINFETLIASARKEEKDKLYPEITKLKTDADVLLKRNNEYLLIIGQKDAELAELKKQVASLEKKAQGTPDGEEVKALKIQVATLQSEKDALEKEKGTMKLDSYKASKIAEAKGEIIPELVFGTTEEDINKSFDLAVAKYKEIITKLGVTNTPPSSNNIPPANPNLIASDVLGTMTPETIEAMDMKAYAEMRKALGFK